MNFKWLSKTPQAQLFSCLPPLLPQLPFPLLSGIVPLPSLLHTHLFSQTCFPERIPCTLNWWLVICKQLYRLSQVLEWEWRTQGFKRFYPLGGNRYRKNFSRKLTSQMWAHQGLTLWQRRGLIRAHAMKGEFRRQGQRQPEERHSKQKTQHKQSTEAWNSSDVREQLYTLGHKM